MSSLVLQPPTAPPQQPQELDLAKDAQTSLQDREATSIAAETESSIVDASMTVAKLSLTAAASPSLGKQVDKKFEKNKFRTPS